MNSVNCPVCNGILSSILSFTVGLGNCPFCKCVYYTYADGVTVKWSTHIKNPHLTAEEIAENNKRISEMRFKISTDPDIRSPYNPMYDRYRQ